MTDTLIDDDIIDVHDVPSTTHRPTTSGSSSSISTSTRRPMFIETEMRTDTVTTRRMASAAASTNVYDVLEKTKSPTDGLPPTTYTYAHSVSYMPVAQNGAYDVPVMARRNLHGGYEQRGSSSSYSTNNTSVFSSPNRFMSNVRSQLASGYSALRDRFTHHSTQQQGPVPGSPSSSHGATGGTRFSRTSSQSSGSGGRTTGYNLRSRPVHSTPRDVEGEQRSHEQQKTTTTTSKQQQRKKNQSHGEIDEEEEEEDDDQGGEKGGDKDAHENVLVHYVKKLLHSPIDLLEGIWHKFTALPWWLLIPLLLFLALYALPFFACKPLEHYPDSKIYHVCKDAKNYVTDLANNSYNFTRRHTYERGLRNLKQVRRSARDVKDSILSSLDDVYYTTRKSLWRSVGDVKSRVADVVESTTENAKEYCDAGLQKMNTVIEELKREREKFLGTRHTLKPDQEKELETLVRQLLDEYTADEIGEADYALEANGAKVVDTRCTEYTDEPRQNVVKFLGIPIVHMSKQPDIMIRPGRMPGQCFPFKGDHGSVVIKLAVPVVPTEFVLEHLSKSISIVGHINSAPKNFTVYALRDKHDKEGIVLGHYFYDAENGPSLQRFKPQITNVPLVEYVEIQVTSNWGNPNYTCVYRFRVHGDMQTVTPSAPPAA